MLQESKLLLGPPGPVYIAVGEKVAAPGYYGLSLIQTVSVRVQSFKGRVIVEGSIVIEPGDDDWFPVPMMTGGDLILDYPRVNPFEPETSEVAYSFYGNYIWLRARMDRTRVLMPRLTEAQLALEGQLDRVLLKY